MLNHNQNEELNKISIIKAKEILNKNGNKYSEAEIKEIRDYLYVLADIHHKYYKKNQDKFIL